MPKIVHGYVEGRASVSPEKLWTLVMYGLGSVGMELWCYPRSFTPRSRYTCVIQRGGLTTAARHMHIASKISKLWMVINISLILSPI